MDDRVNIIKNNIPLIDVRSPIEFNKGAFPSSINIPILDNEQRTEVGIIYKKNGSHAAEELGFKLVKNQKNEIINLWKKFIKEHPSTHIYCMRGGKRSQIAKSWLQSAGINIPAINGGYKALRNTAIEILNSVTNDKKNWIILAGRTGTGKTSILQNLNSAIDLEKHAMHRGSAFGGLTKPQPTAINFENNLASEYIRHNNNILFLEDESRGIGKLMIPDAWHEKMKKSKLIIIELPLEERIMNIAKEYVYNPLKNGISKEKLNKSLQLSLFKIHKRLGPKLYNEISMKIQSILIDSDTSPHEDWIQKLLINYYDPMYDYQLDAKKDRWLLKSNKSDIIKFLNQTEASQSL